MRETFHYIANVRIPTEKAHGIQIFAMCAAFSKMFDVTLIVSQRPEIIQDDPFTYYGTDRTFRILKIRNLVQRVGNPARFFLQSFIFSLSSLFHSYKKRPKFIYTRNEGVAFLHSFFFENVAIEIHTKKDGFLYRIVVKKIRNIVVISKGLKEHLVDLGISAERIFVAHDGVNLSLFDALNKDRERKRFGYSDKETVVAYVGKYKTMGVEKGVDEIFEAIQKIEDQTLRLVVVGLGEQEKLDLQKKIEIGNKNIRYDLIAHVGHAEAVKYMVAADVLIMNYPKLEHYSKYMSPLKLFEYLATGNSVVVSDLPVVREVVSEDEVFFVPPNDVHALASCIAHVSESGNFNKKKEAALTLVSNYSWDARAKNIVFFVNREK